MTTYVALLRGVNVGKAKRVPMATLRELLGGLGYTDAATLLNSGNAVFGGEGAQRPPAEVAAQISEAIRDALGFEVPVVVLTAAELDGVVAEMPFQVGEEEHPRLLVIFAQEPAELDGAEAIEAVLDPAERFARGSRAAYLHCAKGIANSQAASVPIGRSGKGLTTRNLATVLKLQALAERVTRGRSSG